MPVSALMNVMTRAARRAGRSLARDFGEVENLQVSVKGPSDFVSAADHRAEDIILEDLSKARPGYCFLMEERGVIEGPDKTHRWIVDPLDGTTNFLHGIPHFAVSIGLERDGQMVAGLVYNPITDELYTAEKGRGAFLNDRRLRVAARRALRDCVIVTGIPHRGKSGHALWLREGEAVMAEVTSMRRFGSAALDLAYVAAGRFDAFWERGIESWDMAAGVMLEREAGGIATDIDTLGSPLTTGNVLAANGPIHKAMSQLLRSVNPDAKAVPTSPRQRA